MGVSLGIRYKQLKYGHLTNRRLSAFKHDNQKNTHDPKHIIQYVTDRDLGFQTITENTSNLKSDVVFFLETVPTLK